MKRVLYTLLIILVAGSVYAADPIVQMGDRVAIVGDSITEQKDYSVDIEAYLMMCTPELDVNCLQVGWGGETAPAFAQRMENDLIPLKPDVITTCYGMNDGRYRPYGDSIGNQYRDGMEKIVKRMKDANVRMIVGSPGVVDSFSWRREDPELNRAYNANLTTLAGIAKELADGNGFRYAPVNEVMNDVMVKAKTKYGQEYLLAGGDGVHPSPNGHLVMAYVFLKAMGLDGSIGEITVDMNGEIKATIGHKVISSGPGKATIESVKYPFCFNGSNIKHDPNVTAGIIEFFPFQQDLNRFVLKVKNLKAERAEVVWAGVRKDFSREDLEKGINLADEFLDNPFNKEFFRVRDDIRGKQNYETAIIKNLISSFRNIAPYVEEDAELAEATQTVREKLYKKQKEYAEKIRNGIKPITYEIEIVEKNSAP